MAAPGTFPITKTKGRLPQKEGRGRGVRGDAVEASSPPPQAGPECPRAGTNLLKTRCRAGGRAQRQLGAPGSSRPALGEEGRQRRRGAAREGAASAGMGRAAGGGRAAAASGSAAAQRSGDHAWPHPQYRYALSPALSTPPPLSALWSEGRAPENIPSELLTPHPPPRRGPLRPVGKKEEESAVLRREWGRLTAEPPPLAPHHPNINNKHWGPRLPAPPRPGSAASPPPRRSGRRAAASSARGPAPLLPRPAAAAAEPAREPQ
jgi:hypothetical protein